MGNSVRFERLQEEKTSQGLSFESLPDKKDEVDVYSIKKQPKVSEFWKLLLSLTLLILTIFLVIILALAVVVTVVSANTTFISRAEFYQAMNESHAYCMEKVDSIEGFYNDSFEAYDAEIAHLQNQLSGILISQADTKTQLSTVQAELAKQIHAHQERLDHVEVHTDALANKTDSLHTELASLESDVHHDLSNITNVLGELQNLVLLLETNISQHSRQLGVMHDGIQQARNQLSTVQSDTSLSDQLHQLQQHVDRLSTEMHRPVNLYKRCTEDTTSCSIDPRHSRDYWRDCATVYLPLNKEVRYLL